MKTVKIGELEVTIKALNLRTLRAIAPKVESLSKTTSFSGDQIDTILDILEAALSRGNNGITRDLLEDEVDVAQIPALLEAILGASGFEAKRPGEARSP